MFNTTTVTTAIAATTANTATTVINDKATAEEPLKKLPLEVDPVGHRCTDEHFHSPAAHTTGNLKERKWKIFGYAFVLEQFSDPEYHKRKFFGGEGMRVDGAGGEDNAYERITPDACLKIIEEEYRLPVFEVLILPRGDRSLVEVAIGVAFGSNRTMKAMEWLKSEECQALIERVKNRLGVEFGPCWYAVR